MKKILRYFPANQMIRDSEIKSLFKTAGIYLAVAVASSLVENITSWMPLIKNLTYNISSLCDYYALAGIVLSCYQYFTRLDTSDVEYITLDDIKSLWVNPKIKKGLIIAAAVLCLIPHGSKAKTAEVKEEPVAQLEEQNEIEELAKAQEETEVKEAEKEQEQTAKEQESEKAQPVEERFVPGEYVGMTEYPGISLNIYDNGAVVTEHVGFATDIYIPSYVEYCGKEYPVKAIGDDVFSWDSMIYKLYISETVTTIGDRSIQGCQFLNKLHLGDNLMYIGEASVISNEGVEELYIPGTLYEVGAGSLQYNGAKELTILQKEWLNRSPIVTKDGLQPRTQYATKAASYTYSWPAEITEDQQMMRDFYFAFDEDMSIHYQHNNYMDIIDIEREDLDFVKNGYHEGVWKKTSLRAVEYNSNDLTVIYFTTKDVYDKYLENADLITDYGYYINSLDELKNVNVVLQDDFALIFDRVDYEPNLEKRKESAEKEIYRAYEMSKAFTLEKAGSETEILEKIQDKYKLGKYQIKTTDFMEEVNARYWRDENSYLLQNYKIYSIQLNGGNGVRGILTVNADPLVSPSMYGYGVIPDIGCFSATIGNDYYTVLVDNELAPDLSGYPPDWQDASMEQIDQLYSMSFVADTYFTVNDHPYDNKNMNDNDTIDSFKELFERK